jgi:hypothetical protein
VHAGRCEEPKRGVEGLHCRVSREKKELLIAAVRRNSVNAFLFRMNFTKKTNERERESSLVVCLTLSLRLLTHHFLLISVFTSESIFYHPDANLCDHISADTAVTVELVNRVCLNELGVPQLARWAYIAFNCSEHMVMKRQDMLRVQLNEIEETRLSIEADALRKDVQNAKMMIFEMKEIMRPQLYDEEEIGLLMEETWDHMTSGGMLDLCVPSVKEQEFIHKFFLENYMQLSELFKSVAAVGADLGTNTINYMEFSNFLKETKVMKDLTGNFSDELSHIFIEAHVHDEETHGSITIQSEMHQHEFFLSLVRLAVFKHITIPEKMKKSSMYQGAGLNSRGELTPSKALEELHRECFKPYIDKELAGTSIKTAIGTEEILLIFKESDMQLRQVFSSYSNRFSEKSEKSGHPKALHHTVSSNDVLDAANLISGATMMNLQEFGSIIKDAKLLERSTTTINSDELTLKDVRQAFSGAQHDSAVGEAEKLANDEGTRSSHSAQMTYPEFLEAIARIGASKWNEVIMMKSINRAVKAVASIADTDKIKR